MNSKEEQTNPEVTNFENDSAIQQQKDPITSMKKLETINQMKNLQKLKMNINLDGVVILK